MSKKQYFFQFVGKKIDVRADIFLNCGVEG